MRGMRSAALFPALLLAAGSLDVPVAAPDVPVAEPEAPQGIPIHLLPFKIQRLLKSSGTYRIGVNRAPQFRMTVFTGAFSDAVQKACTLLSATGVHHHVEDTRTTRVLFDTARNLPPSMAAKLMDVPPVITER